MDRLPVEELEEDFLRLSASRKARIISSPTGSGKSTRVPLWCAKWGKVLVVEPRRVAARGLARRISAEAEVPPGSLAGWAVRGDACCGPQTQILFVTPGVALRMLAEGSLDQYSTWILDEFHERRAETDLLLAWALHGECAHKLVLLSATLDAPTLARHLDGQILHCEGRTFPVDIEHLVESGQSAPHENTLPMRIERAVRHLEATEGAVLVFLPGVAEIRQCQAWLDQRAGCPVLPLHGSLSIHEQDLAMAPGSGLRIVLSTNVAESAVTIPDVVAVVDSGLERRLERQGGLSHLVLKPIGKKAADQRAGRAGRTRPGRCLRLWAPSYRLSDAVELPIQTEDPDPWLLPALQAGIEPWNLPWLDRPLADAVREAEHRLRSAQLVHAPSWQASSHSLPTSRKSLLALELPLDPRLSGFVLSLLDTAALRDAAALAAALSSSRYILLPRPSVERAAFRQQCGARGGDAELLARTVRASPERAQALGVHPTAWQEARETWQRLCNQLEIPDEAWAEEFQTQSILRAWCQTQPRSLRLRRSNGARVEYSLGGGAGMVLDDTSLAGKAMPELVAVLAFHAGEDRQGKRRIWIDAACGTNRKQALELGLGRLEVLEAREENGQVWARWRRLAGDQSLGERQGLAEDPQIWCKAVALALPLEIVDKVRQRLERLWLGRCLEIGHWIEPPGDVRGWMSDQLEKRLAEEPVDHPPYWPTHLPTPPDLGEPVPPKLLSYLGQELAVRYFPLEGRILVQRPAGAKPPRWQQIPTPNLWKDWNLGWDK